MGRFLPGGVDSSGSVEMNLRKRFDQLAAGEALGKNTPLETHKLVILQKILRRKRTPQEKAEESRAEWNVRCLIKEYRRLIVQGEIRSARVRGEVE